jgi:hypothetical protein
MVSASLHRNFRVATVKAELSSGYGMERVPHALTRNRNRDRSWRFAPPRTLFAIEESLPLFTSAQHTESIKKHGFSWL